KPRRFASETMVSSSDTAGATSSGVWAGGFGKGGLLSGGRPWNGRTLGLGADPTSADATFRAGERLTGDGPPCPEHHALDARLPRRRGGDGGFGIAAPGPRSEARLT